MSATTPRSPDSPGSPGSPHSEKLISLKTSPKTESFVHESSPITISKNTMVTLKELDNMSIHDNTSTHECDGDELVPYAGKQPVRAETGGEGEDDIAMFEGMVSLFDASYSFPDTSPSCHFFFLTLLLLLFLFSPPFFIFSSFYLFIFFLFTFSFPFSSANSSTSHIGSELMIIHVGPNEKEIMVHKDLVCATGKFFEDKANNAQGVLRFPEISHDVFKLFLCYVYQRQVPGVKAAMALTAKQERVSMLIELYTFAEKLDLDPSLLNKTMDAIQDGYHLLDTIPSQSVIQSVYKSTKAGSKLRKFCAATIIGAHRSHLITEHSLAEFIRGNEAFLRDYLEAVRGIVWPDADPRVRDCAGDPDCVECGWVKPDATSAEQRRGFWPCYFHIHPLDAITIKQQNGDSGSEKQLDVITLGNKGNCHLWKH
ncbi:hypothetical protein F5884DRAFT_746965 [Xylogone sp. PMI_703]|nr:hypothetical protein F5884DRAFT_746965 [Xylogone sp. PMI_703]